MAQIDGIGWFCTVCGFAVLLARVFAEYNGLFASNGGNAAYGNSEFIEEKGQKLRNLP